MGQNRRMPDRSVDLEHLLRAALDDAGVFEDTVVLLIVEGAPPAGASECGYLLPSAPGCVDDSNGSRVLGAAREAMEGHDPSSGRESPRRRAIAYKRGSTGSLSSASTPKTHS